jgi:DNA-binding MarR family transcriptional regulator
MSDDEDAAVRVWRGISGLVFDQDRTRQVAEAVGLSFGRLRVLRRLAKHGPSTGRELAARLGADPPYVTLMLDHLEGRGLVVRTPHPTDRRAKLATLTPEGERAAQRADELLDAPPERLRALAPEDLAALDRIIGALRGEAEGSD